MFLLVPAHPGFPGQIPQSRKTVVCVCEGKQEGSIRNWKRVNIFGDWVRGKEPAEWRREEVGSGEAEESYII